jgi:large subunit ribosomal protein L23
MMRAAHQILLRPITLTEKADEQKEQLNKVYFEVALDSNKVEIRNAVESMFDVTVASVNTAIVRGKWKRQGKFIGRRKNWKRAVVTLKDGEISFLQDTGV